MFNKHRLFVSPLLVFAFLSPVAFAGTLVGDGGQWQVRQVNVSNTPGSLDEADLALSGYKSIGERRSSAAQIDFGEGGEFLVNQSFPGLINGPDRFAVEVTGEITVTTPGDISFGFYSDDMARLKIGGATVAESAGVGQSTFGTTNLIAGVHAVELVYYEGLGFEELELFVATTLGTYTDFAAATWELLDATSDLSPTDIVLSSQSFASNALDGSVVGDLSATGGADGGHRFAIAYSLDPTPTSLVAAGALWSYLDNGVASPAGWTSVTYDDNAWNVPSPAPLGYADAAIVTTIGFGPDASNKFTTSFFRHPFMLPVGELARVDSLRLRLLRDDSAAVYINGTEVLRDNLPDGPLDNTVLASSTAGGVIERTYFEYDIDPSVLVEGDNVVAVEVHQASLTSSDVIFDLSLEYERRSSLPADLDKFDVEGNQVVLAVSAASIPASVEVPIRATNAYGASFEETFTLSKGGAAGSDPTAIAIDSDTTPEGGLPGVLVGSLSATDADADDGHSFALVSAGFPDSDGFTVSGAQLFTAMTFDADVKSSYDVRVLATDSTGATFEATVPITISPLPSRISLTPDSLPENAQELSVVGTLATDDPLSDTHTYRLVYPVDPTPVELISFGDNWKYLANGSDQGSAWAGTGFDDTAWAEGASPLGYGLKSEVAPDPAISPTTLIGFGPDENNKYATTYFRKTFNVTDPRLVESMSFEFALDDGAIIYINGIAQVGIRATGVDSFDDYTGQGDGGETTSDAFTLTGLFGGLLVAGQNVIGVEVHQTAGTSSDLWLDLEMTATVRTPNGDSDYFNLVDDQILINREPGDVPASDGDSFTVRIESTSALGDVFTDDVTIDIGPATTNPPTDIALDNASIDELEPAGTLVGNLSSVDADGGPFTYSLEPDVAFPDNALFGIDGDQLLAATLDADDGATRTIRVTTTDGTGLSYSETFPITVNRVDQVPTDITIDPATFPSDAAIGTTIGTLDAVDGNVSDTHTFTFGSVWPERPGAAVLPFGSDWKYRDSGVDLADTWRAPAFDDGLWPEGAGELGYGDGDETTTVAFIDTDPIADGDQKNATTYFRHTLEGVVSTGGAYQMRVRFDDAVAVYINGNEVYRSTNLPVDAAFDTFATATAADNSLATVELAPGVIVNGDNVIAVEIHQSTPTSSDISFDFELRPYGPSPFPAYFSIDGDQLRAAGSFADLMLPLPYTFEVPIVADDGGTPFEKLVLVTMTLGGPDIDNDNLLDAWEEFYFGVGNLTQGPDDDPDKDGASNAEEQAAGTDPTDPSDFLQITSIEIVAGEAVVTWPAIAGHSYSLFRNDDLSNGGWVLVQGDLTVGIDGDLSGTDADPIPAVRAYRVEAIVTPVP